MMDETQFSNCLVSRFLDARFVDIIYYNETVASDQRNVLLEISPNSLEGMVTSVYYENVNSATFEKFVNLVKRRLPQRRSHYQTDIEFTGSIMEDVDLLLIRLNKLYVFFARCEDVGSLRDHRIDADHERAEARVPHRSISFSAADLKNDWKPSIFFIKISDTPHSHTAADAINVWLNHREK